MSIDHYTIDILLDIEDMETTFIDIFFRNGI